jgi:5'-nucleotidase
MHLFIDSDGVFADFDSHVFELFGALPSDMHPARLWSKVSKHPTFWEDMPLKDGALDLWSFVSRHSPTVLTGCPTSDWDRSVAHKRAWWKRHFDHEQVITCMSRDKADHMHNKGDVLVDDMIKNIQRWENSGGVGVLYVSHDQAIADLKTLGFR